MDEVVSVLEEVSLRLVTVLCLLLPPLCLCLSKPNANGLIARTYITIMIAVSQVADFRRWAQSMRQLHTSNAIASQFGGSALQKR